MVEVELIGFGGCREDGGEGEEERLKGELRVFFYFIRFFNNFFLGE